MIRFPVLNLPDELTYLMRAQLNSVEVQQKVVLETINKNYALVQMLESLFQEYDSQKRLPQVIKKISWNQFRDKFTSIYIYHQVHKKFPDKTSLELVRDIQVLEDKLSDYSVGSNSRAFLLGFYLKSAQIKLRQDLNSTDVNLIELPKEVIALISQSTSHSEKVDHLILLLWHLYSFLGVDNLLERIKNHENYMSIYDSLSNEQKKIMIDNFLAYGCSINEQEIFLNERV